MQINFVLGIIFLALALVGVVLKKTYFAVPLNELKRRAEKHDEDAVILFRAASYGDSLKGLLRLFIGFSAAASFILLARVFPVWLSLLVIAPLLYIVFSLLPSTRVSYLGLTFTKLFTPILAWILSYLHPIVSRGTVIVESRYNTSNHTGLYERHDLIDLIERQQKQSDNRLSQEELEIIKRALTFNEKKVSEVLIPRKNVKTLLATDTIGPILINELHENEQEHVLVNESRKGPVVGTLAFKDLNLKSQGHVQDVMDSKLYYLHEDDSLTEALHAFFITNHSLFVVVNSFEEYSGIVTIEAILRELLGHIPGADFDEYTNVISVANRYQRKHEKSTKINEADETPVKTDKEVVK